MTIQIVTRLGGPPIEIEAAQFAVFNDAGTVIAVAGEYGPRGAVRISHAGEGAEFESTKRAFGYGHHQVIVDRLTLPSAPEGARLVAGPGVKQPPTP